MDREEVRRLAHALTAAADSRSNMTLAWYTGVRRQIEEAVAGEANLEEILPRHPAVGGAEELVLQGDLLLRAGAAYLHGLTGTTTGSTQRDLAAADLMDQVRRLLEDEQVHPATPIVLAAAALEETLRDRVEEHAVAIEGRPSILTYAAALKRADALSESDRTMAETVAKVRNDAAHGRFDDLDRTLANVVMSQVSLLVGKLQGPTIPSESQS